MASEPAQNRRQVSRLSTPLAQSLAIILGNILLFGAVWLLLHYGYREHPHHTPLIFLYGEVGLVVGLTVVCFPEYVLTIFVVSFNILRLLWNARRGEDQQRALLPAPQLAKWKARLEREDTDTLSFEFLISLKFVIYCAAAVNFLALWHLVYATGGGLLSPFAPLLLAPAVLGLIIVEKKEGVVLLLAAAVAIAFGTDWLAATSPHDRTGMVGKPRWGTFAIVPLILVFCAALLRWVTLPSTATSPRLKRLVRALARATRRDRVLPPNGAPPVEPQT